MKEAWLPLRHRFFRAMWIASVVSNIGTWMHTVAAAWLMTTLAASPLLVGLVQTATTLPVFLLALPSGAAADLMNRRKVLIFTQSWMLAVAAVLGVLALMGKIGPWALLGLTFALGLGSAMNWPAWAATIPELVPREELAAAVSLNSVGFNIARAVGPALGGSIMAATSAGVVFLLNAISFLAVIVVVWNWRYTRPVAAQDEGLNQALREGLQYVRSTPAFYAVLVRVGLFGLGGSALWAMLPVVVSEKLGGTSLTYGILLGCLGAGAVIGAAILAPLRARYSPDRLVLAGIFLFAGAAAALALITHFGLLAMAMVAGGIAWMTVMSTFVVCAQMAPPTGMRARALAYYLLVFQGAMAAGGATWGAVAGKTGVGTAILIAVALMIAGLATGTRLRLAPKVKSEPDGYAT